jgi:uncharacterized membrane protein
MNKKVIGLALLAVFAMMQIAACFVAGNHTEGFTSVFFYVLGGISCLFGIILDFLLLVIAVDVFGSVFGIMAENMGKKQEEEDEDEEIEIVDTPE